MDIAFYCALLVYFANLTYHYVKSYIELKLMSYFKLRFRLQSILCAWMLINYSLIIFAIPTVHSPDFAHNFLQQTADILQEMDRGKSRSDFIVSNQTINDKTAYNGADSGLKMMKGYIYEYNNQGVENQSTMNHHHQYFHQHIKSNLRDNSIIEITSLSQNDKKYTGITSIFPPHSFLKHFYRNNNLQTSPTTTSTTGDSFPPPPPSLEPRPRLLTWLPANYLFDSACTFLCYIIVNNLYVLSCAYFYWPIVKQDPHISCGEYLPSKSNSNGFIDGDTRPTNKEIDSQQ